MTRQATQLRSWIVGGALLLVAAVAITYLVLRVASPLTAAAPDIFVFAGLRGPVQATMPQPSSPASWEQYGAGTSSRLAILLTDPDSAWIGLAHGLKTIGVPFRITRDAEVAAKHDVVIVYPTISGKVLTATALKTLAGYPARGGTLIGFGVEGGGLEEVFGFKTTATSRNHRAVQIDTSRSVTAGFTDEREKTLPVNPPGRPEALAMLSYSESREAPIASYDDGSAAIIHRQVGTGHAYAFGIDVGFLLLKGYNGRQEQIARSYVNEYEPTLDVLLRLIRNMYVQGSPAAVTLDTVPDGKRLSVVISHDIDYTRSLRNALEYAELEHRHGISATHFIQTKYVRDWNDDVFFNDAAVPVLRRLSALGMEIASHSVSHARTFSGFPLGDGLERYPDYRPFVVSRDKALNGSILGEARVSRFLLAHFLPGQPIESFRPGHLANPHALPQALQATGYRYSSSVTANNSLTHLPFRLTASRETTAQSDVYEFPVTVEDERPPALHTRLRPALDLADKLSRYGGLFMVLIHPDVVGQKLDFESRLLDALKERAWFGSLQQFGKWWVARDRVEWDVARDGERWKITIRSPDPVDGLALVLPQGARFIGAEPARSVVTQQGQRLIVGQTQGSLTLTVEMPRIP